MRISRLPLLDPLHPLLRRQRIPNSILAPQIEPQTRDKPYTNDSRCHGCRGAFEIPSLGRLILVNLPDDEPRAVSYRHVDANGRRALVVARVAIQHPHVVEPKHYLHGDQYMKRSTRYAGDLRKDLVR